jgi:hypothetical protein
MRTHLRNTAKKFIQEIASTMLTLFLMCTIYAPWEFISYTTSAAHSIKRESNAVLMPFAYASSYSNATTMVTANGKTVVTKSSNSGPTSSSASVITVVSGADGASGANGRDGISGTEGADGLRGSDGTDGVVLSSDAHINVSDTKDADEVHLQILRALIEKLNQLLALLREAN